MQTISGGRTDGFLTKLTSAGSLSFSTYIGGSGDDHAAGVALDGSGAIYIAGGTFSTNFPTTAALQSANAGGQDAFVMKISAAGNQRLSQPALQSEYDQRDGEAGRTDAFRDLE